MSWREFFGKEAEPEHNPAEQLARVAEMHDLQRRTEHYRERLEREDQVRELAEKIYAGGSGAYTPQAAFERAERFVSYAAERKRYDSL